MPGTDLKRNCLFLNPRVHMTRSRTFRWILPIGALAAAGYFGWQRYGTDHTSQAESPQKRTAAAARNAVPVKIAPVEKADFPVYLTGLGDGQGFNTVVVRTRGGGQIGKIAFTEGQLVKQADVLLRI